MRSLVLGVNSVERSLENWLDSHQVRSSPRLQWLFWGIWGLCLFDFNRYAGSPGFANHRLGVTVIQCWEHFPNCRDFFSMEALPFGYGYSYLMAIVFSFIFASGFLAIRKSWAWAMGLLAAVILWKAIFVYVLTDQGTNNFEAFHILPAAMFLFSREKLRNMRVIWVTIYSFAAFVKLDDAWIAGTYFSSLSVGLPIFPDAWIPLATNSVIVFEIVGSIGLYLGNSVSRRMALWGWTIFHLYSVTVVAFYYPVRCLLLLWLLFGFLDLDGGKFLKSQAPFFCRRNIAAVMVYLFFLAGNLIALIIPAPVNETFEGMNYGMHMINSNHQCINYFSIRRKTGDIRLQWQENTWAAMSRCYPFQRWNFHRVYTCPNLADDETLEWRFLHSRNGSPFRERINEPSLCNLEYLPFRHNSWIRSDEEGAPVVGYPTKNSIQSGSGRQPNPSIGLKPNIQRSALQNWIMHRISWFVSIYGGIWALTIAVWNLYLVLGDKSLVGCVTRYSRIK